MNKKITFTSPLKGFIPEPQPSLLHVPKPYKDLPLFVNTETKSTVKRCVPFLDALTTGYIIPFPIDIEVYLDVDNNEIKFLLPSQILYKFDELIGVHAHNEYQISDDMKNSRRTLNTVFKFLNPWQINTPKGYSCLFITPFNHVLPFELITGVVDTDTYPKNVQFPFYWTRDLNQRTVLKAGSPMVMVFPFKRESWKMETKVCKLTQEKRDLISLDIFKKIADNYKSRFWSKKSYK